MLGQLISTMCRRPIVLAACKVSLVVGTMLNAINQGDRLIGGLELGWGQVAMNYLVPWCVSSYSAARAVLRSTEMRE